MTSVLTLAALAVLAAEPAAASAATTAPSPSAPVAPSPAAIATAPPVDVLALADEVAAALEKTVTLADADIVSEIEAGGYRIGLVIGPPRPIRPRMGSGRFIDAKDSAPDPANTFVGIVLREPRTKRFLPAATLRVNFEMEGGGEHLFYEMTGPYPVYGENVLLRKPGTVRGPNGIDDLRAITVTVDPPAYHRHAEMLGSFVAPAVARFEIAPKSGSKGAPWHAVKDPVKPKPIAEDWKIGDDLRQAIGESRQVVRAGDFALGFIAEGPEPIWLWKGAEHPPECLAVQPNQNTHLELMMIDVPTGLMVTGADVTYLFWRRASPTAPREEKKFLLRPLLAEFYHYGLTADVPAGAWNVTAQIQPPRNIDRAWGDGAIPVPQSRLAANFQFTREGAAEDGPVAEAARFSQRLADAAAKYVAGDHEGALTDTTETFFSFEGSSVDAKLRASDPASYKSLESDWIELRTKMQRHARPEEIEKDAAAVGQRLVALVAANTASGGGGSGSAFVQSFLVLLREGFEAILVLGLLAAVMRKTGRTEGLVLLKQGTIAALAASVVLALVFVFAFNKVAGGRARETFEGVTMLLAVVVLFFTSFWLISRVEGRRWAMFVKHQLETAVTGGRRRAIFGLAFLVVFREGAETVLLYASLFASSPGATGAIVGGIAVASAALVVIFFLSVKGGAVLPVRPFFGVTGALLYVLAFKLAGDGVFELQSADVVGRTAVAWAPASAFLRTWLGVHPTAETLSVQAALLLAVVIGLAWTLLKRPPHIAPAAG